MSLFKKFPYITNAVLGFSIASASDVICQKYIEEKEEIDFKRVFEMSMIRAVVMTPFLQIYFPFLEKLSPGTTTKAVLKRLAIDQCIGAPLSLILTFSAVAVVRDGGSHMIIPKIQQQLIPSWQRGATYWPIVHFFNFKFLPSHYHPLVAHSASFVWNIFISYRANMKVVDAVPNEQVSDSVAEPVLPLPVS